MKHLRPATQEEESTDRIFLFHNSTVSRDKYVEELTEFLKPYDMSIGDLYLCWDLFL
jgi:hypothetical protein